MRRKFLILGKYGGRDAGLLFRSHLRTLLAEVQVAFGLERHEVDVGVGNFHPEHRNADALAGHRGLQGRRHLAGKSPQAGVGTFVKMEDVVVLHIARNDQGVAFGEGVNVQKGVELIVLRHFP